MCNKQFFSHANHCTLIKIEMLIFIKQNISILVWNIFHLNLNHICIKSFLILCNICKKFWVFGVQQYKSKKGIWEALWRSGFVAFAVFSTPPHLTRFSFSWHKFGRLTIRCALFVRGSTNISEFFVPDNSFSLVQILGGHIPKCWSG